MSNEAQPSNLDVVKEDELLQELREAAELLNFKSI